MIRFAGLSVLGLILTIYQGCLSKQQSQSFAGQNKQQELYANDIEIVYQPDAVVFNVVSGSGVKGTYLVSGQLRMKLDRSRSPSSHSHGSWLVRQSRLPEKIEQDSITNFKIDRENNNILPEWRDMGSPAYLKHVAKEYPLSKNVFSAATDPHQLIKSDDSFELEFSMEIPEVALIEIELV